MARFPGRPRLSELTDDTLVYVGTDNTGEAYICAEPLMWLRANAATPVRHPVRMTFGEYKRLPNACRFWEAKAKLAGEK